MLMNCCVNSYVLRAVSLRRQISSSSACFSEVNCLGSRMNNQVAVFEEKRSAPVAGARVIFSGSSRSACDIRAGQCGLFLRSLVSEFLHTVAWLHESRLASVARHKRRKDQRHSDAGTGAHWWVPLPV